MTGAELAVCGWCGKRFRPRAGRGPVPKYCSNSHRQRAYEARRAVSTALTAVNRPDVIAALRTSTESSVLTRVGQALAGSILAEQSRRMAEMYTVPVMRTLAEQSRRMAEMYTVPVMRTLAEQSQWMAEMYAPAVRTLAEAWKRISPPNWPADASWGDMVELIADTGWSLTYVPRADVNALLLQAEPADQPTVLLAHADEIVADCRECVAQVGEPAAAHLVIALDEALDAFAAGLVVPCQTTVASVLSDVINRALDLSFHVAAKELAEDPGEMPMPYFRFWLIASAVPHALAQYRRENGDAVPARFNRHASAHTVDPRQFTKLNALVGLMLAVGLVREIASDLANDLDDGDDDELSSGTA